MNNNIINWNLPSFRRHTAICKLVVSLVSVVNLFHCVCRVNHL